ncbi:MAG TPA: tripartite tricarboxylate transporter substrate binding protein [Xanthobacteraceae bacterium]|nr:tripartite tricarboxylate transporter substrate binding protein [Xanthobacteraceae bacterium]
MKSLLSILLTCICLAFAAAPAAAQDKYPSRPIKILVPYAPGGATDIVARVLGDRLRDAIGASVVVENKPGAYGILALESMARSAPDGYTLMLGNVTTNAITPILYHDKLHINYEKDVVPVLRLVDIPEFLLAATKNFAPKTVPELADYARKNPGKVNYGSVGVGSYPDYDMALFAKRAGDLKMQGIPNKAGASGVLTDMLSGSTQVSFLNVASSAGLIASGQLRPLALVNRTRLPAYPDVPTMQEVGFDGVGTLAWQALFAPAGTPKDVLETLRTAMTAALASPAVVANFDKQHFNRVPTASLDDAKAWLAGEMARWKKITTEVPIDLQQ